MTTMVSRLDPELAGLLEGFVAPTEGAPTLRDIPAMRAVMAMMAAATRDHLPSVGGVTTQDRVVPGPGGAPDVLVRIYRPAQRPGSRPALLWIHGGGYVLGNMDGDDLLVKQLVAAVQCVVVSVEYRLAPEHPFPAAIEDCYAALKWLVTHTGELGINPARVAIGGASAGGGLAAGLALLARDRAEVDIAFQLLIYPMLDDRNVTQASDAVPDALIWTRENNLIGWSSYLGRAPGGETLSPYAAAARAGDLTRLPPVHILVGELDLFLDENVAYAQRLIRAGVPTGLHVYPGACHGFEALASGAAVSQRMIRERDSILTRALHG